MKLGGAVKIVVRPVTNGTALVFFTEKIAQPHDGIFMANRQDS
jgi:hypothetical protein